MDLRQSWEGEAATWIANARDPARDASFWRHNLPTFLDLLPPPGARTLDVGCGEGRLARQLAALGHRVVGIDGSATMATAAATHPDPVPVAVADAARLPFANGSFDLVVAFMVLHDVDRMEEAVGDAARVTLKGGRICIAITHPIQGIGDFAAADGRDRRRRYVVERPYVEERRLTYWLGTGASRVALHSRYRPTAAYAAALERAGLLIEALREPAPPDGAGDLLPDLEQRRLVPSFLHIRAVRP